MRLSHHVLTPFFYDKVRTESNDIVIYKAFQYLPEPGEILHEGDQELTDCHSESIQGDRLALRFSRVHHEHVSRTTSRGTSATEQDQEPETMDERRRLIPFNDVAGFTGVFLAGPQPVWLMCSCKSFVRVHPMSAKGEIIGFTQFHNVNCRHGFITVDANVSILWRWSMM